ncbi:MAG: tRNA1Val (adenine37-N6)-methyltransferase [Cyclobacteriaceae bacterium]|jgi:tRNA1Val (adenine37-N6)-methyltransferase
MPNSFFQFKQFRIDQAQSAMKVTTEGCLFGALVATPHSPKRILDIGSGTGLLTLMLAQRYLDAEIDAVEIDKGAFEETKSNFLESPWSSRLKVHHCAIQGFETEHKFELIVSNPPFFKSSLKGNSTIENQAKHEQSLDQKDLLTTIEHLLDENGVCWVIYPEHEANTFAVGAEDFGLFLTERIDILNHPESRIFRVAQCYSKIKIPDTHRILHIKEKDDYSQDFKALLGPFYLAL